MIGDTLADDDDVTVPQLFAQQPEDLALGVVGEARLVGQCDRHRRDHRRSTGVPDGPFLSVPTDMVEAEGGRK